MDDLSFETIVAEPHTALAAADVILALDRASQREFTVYGIPSLESSATLRKPSAMRVVRVVLDVERHELDDLMSLVRRVKGHDG